MFIGTMEKNVYVKPSARVREICLETRFLDSGDYSGNIEPIGEDDWGDL